MLQESRKWQWAMEDAVSVSVFVRGERMPGTDYLPGAFIWSGALASGHRGAWKVFAEMPELVTIAFLIRHDS